MHLIGKKYIGITKQKPTRRWNNGKGYIRNTLFFRAINKYGWHNIEHKILYTDLKEKDAKELEIKLIKEYKSNDKDYGYNISSGGEGTNGIAAWNKGTKGLTTAWNKGIKTPIEIRKKLSVAHKGKHLSEEHKRKIGRKGKLNAKSMPVICVETGEYFESINLAAQRYNLQLTNIAKVCKGERQRAGKMHWKYAE